MKVLHIIDKLSSGGAQTLVKGILENGDRDKYLFVLRKTPVILDVKCENVIINNSKSKYSFFPVIKLKQIIEKNKIDILHCHLFRAQVIGYILKMLFFPEIKLIFHEHGQIFGSESFSKLEDFMFLFFLKVAKKKVDLFIAVSKETKRQLISKATVNRELISVIYNYVNLDLFSKDNSKSQEIEWNISTEKGDFFIGFIGRLSNIKGWKVFVDAALLLRKYYNFKFIIAGNGKDEAELLKLIKQHSLEKSLFYLGYVSDVNKLYNILDCTVVPSFWESMGITVVESQAAGVPVIASDVAALNEIIEDGQNGLLFKLKDVEDLSKKIVRIYNDEGRRDKVIENAYATVRKYSLSHYMKRLVNEYTCLLRL